MITDILELPATTNQVHGVFNRNSIWFTAVEDETNKKSIKYRLLTGAKDFAKLIIDGTSADKS